MFSNGYWYEGQCCRVHLELPYSDVQSRDNDLGRGVLSIHAGTGIQNLGTSQVSCSRGSRLSDSNCREG